MGKPNKNNKNAKSGGFQSLGLSDDIFRGVMRMGYKVPTPVQRKALPVCLLGGDVVCMARTGSGKTAAFVVPMLEKLLSSPNNTYQGARGLILSPTRDLALQTLKVIKSMGKFTEIRAVPIVGGDGMEKQVRKGCLFFCAVPVSIPSPTPSLIPSRPLILSPLLPTPAVRGPLKQARHNRCHPRPFGPPPPRGPRFQPQKHRVRCL